MILKLTRFISKWYFTFIIWNLARAVHNVKPNLPTQQIALLSHLINLLAAVIGNPHCTRESDWEFLGDHVRLIKCININRSSKSKDIYGVLGFLSHGAQLPITSRMSVTLSESMTRVSSRPEKRRIIFNYLRHRMPTPIVFFTAKRMTLSRISPTIQN